MLSKNTAFRVRSLPSSEPSHWKYQIKALISAGSQATVTAFLSSEPVNRKNQGEGRVQRERGKSRQGNFPPTLEAAPYTCELMTPLLGSSLTPEQSSEGSKS